ncbi:MAG: hypothetical protein NT046_09910 [Arenimonas sp.]|nr:hypothetical protein [Arenimonas sp.]
MKTLLLCLALLPAFATAATVEPWALPAPVGSAQPHLSQASGGDLLLSWIEKQPAGGDRLMFARQDAKDARWSAPRVIAQGSDWFVNWADFPALQALPDGSLWAHTLVKNGAATYAYDVRLHVSRDGGRHWQPADAVHDDGTPTEHGFASLWPQSRDQLGIVWLDGRKTAGGHDHADHGGAGAMTMRSATFDAAGKRRTGLEIDAMTCDCCQTDTAMSDAGVLVAYRDREPGEIRDIKVTRFDGQAWTAPATVHADRWFMPACPVNGPAVGARGRQAWVAWYTGAGPAPSVRIAASSDAGARFGPMRQVAVGEAQLGRVDLAADASGVWMSWMQEAGGEQSLWLARFDPALATEQFRVRVATVAGRGRGTGFPRMQVQGGSAWLAWTEVVGGKPRLRGARVRP